MSVYGDDPRVYLNLNRVPDNNGCTCDTPLAEQVMGTKVAHALSCALNRTPPDSGSLR